MRESKIRLITHLTGILALVILIVHGYFVIFGNFQRNISFNNVETLIHDNLYFALLGSLLIFALIHAGLGVRKSLNSTNVSKNTYLVIIFLYIFVSLFLIYLYITTVV